MRLGGGGELPDTAISGYSQDGEDTGNYWKLGHQKVADCHHPRIIGQEMELGSDY